MFNRILRAAGTLLVLVSVVGCAAMPSAATQRAIADTKRDCHAGDQIACLNLPGLYAVAENETNQAAAQNAAVASGFAGLLLGAAIGAATTPTYGPVYVVHSYGRGYRR